jgi:hypothetical protein
MNLFSRRWYESLVRRGSAVTTCLTMAVALLFREHRYCVRGK